MKSTVRIVLILLALFGAATSARAQGSMLWFTSTPQSVIGQGETFTASTTNGFTISADFNANNGVSFVISSETRYWFLDFAAPGNAQITPGLYSNAMIFPSQTGPNPGMLFWGEGRIVTSVSGYFNVLEVDYGPGNTVNRFYADFLQNDQGDPSQMNMGMIRFDLNPVPEPGLFPLAAAGILALFLRNRRRSSIR